MILASSTGEFPHQIEFPVIPENSWRSARGHESWRIIKTYRHLSTRTYRSAHGAPLDMTKLPHRVKRTGLPNRPEPYSKNPSPPVPHASLTGKRGAEGVEMVHKKGAVIGTMRRRRK